MSLTNLRAHEKSLSLVYNLAPDVPTFLAGDVMRLRQILLNLIGNAIKFTERGEVALRVEHEPGAREAGLLRFSVSDTGIGIPADKLDAIFKSFTQVDSSTSRKYGGTGLGLTISKRLVELMGGRIWVESVSDHGTTFYSQCGSGSARGRLWQPARQVRTAPRVIAGSGRELHVLSPTTPSTIACCSRPICGRFSISSTLSKTEPRRWRESRPGTTTWC